MPQAVAGQWPWCSRPLILVEQLRGDLGQPSLARDGFGAAAHERADEERDLGQALLGVGLPRDAGCHGGERSAPPEDEGESLIAVMQRRDVAAAMQGNVDVEVLYRGQGQVGSGGEEITESPVVLVRRVGSVPKIPAAPGGEGTR